MFRLKAVRGVAALAATLVLSGCAATFSGYDLAPSGLAADEDALRRALAFEPADAYASVLEGSREMPEDGLLRLLYAGLAGRYAGAYDESSHLLDLASYLAEDRVTTSISRQALSMITSDRALAYVPSRTERLMIHYVAALNFLEAGDPDGAAVEARRIEAMLDRLGEAGDGTRVSDHARFLHTFAGSVFEAAGDRNAAEVAYRRAGFETEQGEMLRPVGETVAYTGDGLLGTATHAERVPGDSLGEVVVVVERGFVPHRVEQSVAVVLPPWKVAALTDGDAGEKALAATEAAARILVAASRHYGDRSGYYRDHGWRRGVHLDPWECDYGCRRGEVHPTEAGRVEADRSEADDGDTGDETPTDPYILRISWPVLYQDGSDPESVRVRVGELGIDPVARFDVADGVRRDFEDHRTTMLARTLARAVSKAALSLSAKSAVEKKDEAAGRVIGFLANLGTMLTERADTRSWHLLPHSVSIARLRLPAGTHDVAIEVGGGGERTVSLGVADVRPGETVVLTHRIWR